MKITYTDQIEVNIVDMESHWAMRSGHPGGDDGIDPHLDRQLPAPRC